MSKLSYIDENSEISLNANSFGFITDAHNALDAPCMTVQKPSLTIQEKWLAMTLEFDVRTLQAKVRPGLFFTTDLATASIFRKSAQGVVAKTTVREILSSGRFGILPDAARSSQYGSGGVYVFQLPGIDDLSKVRVRLETNPGSSFDELVNQ